MMELLTVLSLGLLAFGIVNLPRGHNAEITMVTFMAPVALLAGLLLLIMLFIVPIA